MTMVEFMKMGDKHGQKRHRRMNGAGWSVATRSAVEKDRPVASQVAQTTQGRSSVDREPSSVGRDLMDSPQRGSLAGPAREIPASLDLLAGVARLGGAGRLVVNLGGV